MSPSDPAKKAQTYAPHPDDLTDVVAALDEADRGDLMTLTPEDLDRIAETGIWPDFVRDPE